MGGWHGGEAFPWRVLLNANCEWGDGGMVVHTDGVRVIWVRVMQSACTRCSECKVFYYQSNYLLSFISGGLVSKLGKKDKLETLFSSPEMPEFWSVNCPGMGLAEKPTFFFFFSFHSLPCSFLPAASHPSMRSRK